ncbi:hypothetical protein [Streptomyces sp. NPDC059909]|uniref:hypothetical protein n=1 Tax=Streptomyces sp. NPDC059909 TaxID=3346998 RepID=UPI003653B7CD
MSDQQPDQGHIEARQVAQAWGRIEAWLAEHAPASFTSLKAGASEEEIAALEGSIGVRVSDGVKALWQMHAGAEVTGLVVVSG